MKAIGIKLADGTFYPVIGDGEPSEKELVLTTVKDNQTRVIVDLYRTDTDSIDDAEYVDSLQIDNLVAHPNGSANISLSITLDENGKLSAFMRDPETGATSNSNVTLVSRTLEERLAPIDYDIVDSSKDDDEDTEERSVDPEEADLQSDTTQDNNGEKLAAAGLGLAAGGLLAAAAAARKDSPKDETVSDADTAPSDDFALPDFDDTEFEDSADSRTEPIAAENLSGDDEDITTAGDIASSDFDENNDDSASDVTVSNEGVPGEETQADLQEDSSGDSFDDFALPDFGESSGAGSNEKSAEDTKDGYDFDMPDFDDTEFDDTQSEEPDDTFDKLSDAATDKAEEIKTDGQAFDMPDFSDIDDTVTSAQSEAGTDKTVSGESDDMFADDFTLPDFDEPASSDDTLVSDKYDSTETDDFDIPDFDETEEQSAFSEDVKDGSENDDVLFSDEPALEDGFDFSEKDKDLPSETADDKTVAGGGLLAAANEKISQDSEETFPDFDLPDFDDKDLQNTGTASSYNDDFMEDIDSMDSKKSGNGTASGGINFDGLYDKETMEGNSYHDDNDEIKKKTKTPVIICIICAIICVIATLLILFVVPSRYNLLTKAHKSENITESVEPKPEQPEVAPIRETPPVVEAKEEEIVIAPEPEQVVPEPPKESPKKPEDKIYKIKWGDTLWDIADTYYKNPWEYKMIARYNNIRDPDYIISGTTIKLPAK